MYTCTNLRNNGGQGNIRKNLWFKTQIISLVIVSSQTMRNEAIDTLTIPRKADRSAAGYAQTHSIHGQYRCPQCCTLDPRRQTPRDGTPKANNIITAWGQELTPPTIIAGYLQSHGSQQHKPMRSFEDHEFSICTDVALHRRWDERGFSLTLLVDERLVDPSYPTAARLQHLEELRGQHGLQPSEHLQLLQPCAGCSQRHLKPFYGDPREVHHLDVLEAPQGAQQLAQAQSSDLAVRYGKLQNENRLTRFLLFKNLQGWNLNSADYLPV